MSSNWRRPHKAARDEVKSQLRLEGFHDSRDGVFNSDAYGMGWEREAYIHGHDDWVSFMATEVS